MTHSKPLPLRSGEHLLLEAQGACKQESRAGWKLGRLFLTDQRVGCHLSFRVALGIPLGSISSIAVEKRPFILCSRNVIILACTPRRERGVSSRFWLITNDLDTWRARLYQMTQLKVDEVAIARLAAALEPEAAAILWHIWHNDHADIQELSRLVDAERHSDVLLKIKAQINPLAVEQLGCPILTLLPAGLDPRTGQQVRYAWWVAGRRDEERRKVRGADPAPMDVFDEETHVDVVVELPGVRQEDVLLDVRDGELVISGASATGQFRNEVPLPPGVDPHSLTSQLNNGMLLVRLKRPEVCVR